jgi:hypothetical protein
MPRTVSFNARPTAPTYIPYDRLSEINQGAVVEYKRPGHALQPAQRVQAQRDDQRASGLPSREFIGAAFAGDNGQIIRHRRRSSSRN